MCYLVTGKAWYSYLGLTDNNAFILIMYNPENQLLAQAGGKYLRPRPRPSPVTPTAGFCTHPPCSPPRTCCSPKILGAESCSSPHPASPFSPGIRPDNSGPGERTAPTGSLALFGGGKGGVTGGRNATISFINHFWAPIPCQACAWHFGLTSTVRRRY